MTQAKAELLSGRPKEELSSGLGQEARDRYTGEEHQITDMLTSGPHLCIWVCGLEGTGWLQGRGMGAITPKVKANWKSS